MIASKTRKACSNCYQKKVRCDWKEDSQRCTFCTEHDLQCSLPDANRPAKRSSIRETLKDLEARLHRLESQSHSAGHVSREEESNPTIVSSHNISSEESPDADASNWATQEIRALQSAAGLGPPRESLEWHSMQPAYGPSGGVGDDLYGDIPDSRYLTEESQAAEISDTEPIRVSKPQLIQSHRGSTSPWNVLNEGIKVSSPSTVSTPFNITMIRLSNEDRSTLQKSNRISWDLLHELPHLTPELVFMYVKDYAADAPFPIICWVSFELSIEQGLTTKSWSQWGEIVCVLLYLAFGSAHLNVSSPEPNEEIYFQQAWNMLPHLLLEQNLWSVKALTLMVHYLQAGSLPEPCYALIGSASRMAIGLGFHTRTIHSNNFTPIEEEEGRRSWWLCYIMEKTLSVVLGRPSIKLDLPDAELPSLYQIPPQLDFNDSEDQEAVDLYCDIIETIRTRETILQTPPPPPSSESLEDIANDRMRLIISIIDKLKAKSRLKRPLDFKFTKSITLRATISDLCFYNSIIVLSRYLDPDTISQESIQAARISIKLISANHATGMIMCLWMWLYYGFSATIPLFLSVLQNPLSSSVSLNLALISDLEAVCKSMASSSPGARRVMEVTSLMGQAGFEAVKARAKRKAEEEVDEGSAKRVELEPGVESNTDIAVREGGQLENVWPPETFSWDDWDQWLANSMPSPK